MRARSPGMDQIIAPADPHTMPRPRHLGRKILAGISGVLVIAIIAAILLWNWDWFIPIVEARASAALGRRVTLAHLHVRLGRDTVVTAEDVVIANPDHFPAAKPLARIGQLTVVASVMDYIHDGAIVLPSVAVDHAQIDAMAQPDGANNWTIHPPAQAGAKTAPPPRIGDVRITDGVAHIVDPAAKSDFIADIGTRAATASEPAAIVITLKGSYAAQPISGRFVGGALLSLRDTRHPYPIDLHLANGMTKVSLVGTVENPLNFAGARLKLDFSGPNMADLFPLTGVPIPETPPFSLTGNLDYRDGRIRFDDFAGRVGASDLEGDVDATPRRGTRPVIDMTLRSRAVNLADLGGFIGAPAGNEKDIAGASAAQKQRMDAVKTSKTLFPSTPINLPKLRAADVHLAYRAEHIENRATPFDKLRVKMDIVDGKIDLHPLDFVVGNGNIESSITLAPGAHDLIHANADIKFQHIELARVMQATHSFKGNGIIGGEARLDTDGNSMASMMGQGNGELKLVLVSAGNVSALLVDLAGLEFGNALLSALGIPNQAKIDCFVTDLPMHDGIVDTKALLLDTDEARVMGKGTIDLRNQTLNYALTTRSKHFSIGSLPGPIDITGPIGDPSIRPGTEVVARAGAAAALGVLLTPLGALLPTIQFGVGKDNACTKAEAAERQPLRAPPPSRRRAHK
jgi:uncharacterized protein involved in outer membrane biogenesis